jgi:hypothetical protein
MTKQNQSNDDNIQNKVDEQLIRHLEAGSWDPYRQTYVSRADQARLVFELQKAIRRKKMWRIVVKSLMSMVWIVGIVIVIGVMWTYFKPDDTDELADDVEPALVEPLVEPGQSGEDENIIPVNETATPTPVVGEFEIDTPTTQFGSDIALINYNFTLGKIDGQAYLLAHLYWDAVRDVTDELNLFIHIKNQAGDLVWQQDTPIFVNVGGQTPAEAWMLGTIVEQSVETSLPPEVTTTDPYHLSMGLYSPNDGERLPVWIMGQPQADNQLDLGEIQFNDDEVTIAPDLQGLPYIFSGILQPNVLNITEQQLLLLHNEQGVAVVAFEFFGNFFGSNAEADYRWRYLDLGTSVETAGEGHLFEDYARTPTADGVSLVDEGGQLHATIADMSVEWSYGSDISGWIYYNPFELEGKVIVGDFDTLDLTTAVDHNN